MCRIIVVLALCLVWAIPGQAESFVQVSGLQFIRDGQPYFYAGCNYWYGMNLASAGLGGDRERLHRELDNIVALGLRNLRVMAGSEGPATEPWRMLPPLQIAPGEYDPAVLDGLDYLVAAMAERGLHAVMCLANFWHWSGGLAQYVNWNGGGAIPYPPPEPGGDWNVYQEFTAGFYSNAGAKQAYRDHVSFLLDRVNPYTGRSYAEEPAILAWELANEPRGFNTNAAAFNVWIDETAQFIKSLDANHLVTTGCEGDTPWPGWNGLDFAANHDGASIDYATVHIWPQNWGWFDPGDAENSYPGAETEAHAYLSAHVAAATSLNKPLVLEEFGLARDGGSHDPAAATTWRDAFLAAMYADVHASAAAGGPLAGDNFWSWAGEGRPLEPYGGEWSEGDPWIGDPPHESQGWYSVYDADATTLAVIASHATAMVALNPPTGVATPGARGELRLELYPTPSRGRTWIAAELPAGLASGRLELFDVQGRRRLSRRLDSGRTDLVWSLGAGTEADLAAGTYLLRLSCSGAATARKLTFLR